MIFTVIYSFKVLPEKCDSFEESWSQLTKLIYEYEGSLGSRLHRVAHETKVILYTTLHMRNGRAKNCGKTLETNYPKKRKPSVTR